MRLIGIKLGDCNPLVRKGLKDNTWYPFGLYQEPTKENGWQWCTEQQTKDNNACCQIYRSMADNKSESLEITVNCIVGKNGSGKSTLLDILYRIINNFSYNLFTKTGEDNDMENSTYSEHCLYQANGLEATLFFETDGCLGSIYNCYQNVFYNYYSLVEDASFINEKVKSDFSKDKLSRLSRHLFYTLCTNYSIHSLNESDYVPNRLFLEYNDSGIDGKWLKGLFHKNDGYVVPVTMMPYRDANSNININNENYLAKQRLATLAVLFASQGKKFLGVYSPKFIRYRFRDNFKDDYNERFNQLFNNDFPLNSYCRKVNRLLINCWKKILIGHYTKGFNSLSKDVQEAILSYFAYKTLKTCVIYRGYGEILGVRDITDEEKEKSKKKGIKGLFLETDEEKVIAVIKEILFQEKNVYSNQKILQLINFIEFNTYSTNDDESLNEVSVNAFDIKKDVAFGWYRKPVTQLYTEQNESGNYIRHSFRTFDEAYKVMPPAIFEWEISFTKGTSSDEETLSQMSSGERQLMHSISYIIYHIKNIESVTGDKNGVKYHNICLIFDEAELYYHPEYQRSFISDLIKMLSWTHINHNIIRGVNILIVTHSPFVLSDIPLINTLYLNQGEVAFKRKETFCGNVHELLGGNFFMDYSIGNVARENVEEIIALYNQRLQNDKYEENKTLYLSNYLRYEYISRIIADNYLKLKIKEMLGELKILFEGDSSDDSIDREILDAKAKLNQLMQKRSLIKPIENNVKN